MQPDSDIALDLAVEEECCLIVDGMAVLEELMAVKNLSNCNDFGKSYVKLMDSKA